MPEVMHAVALAHAGPLSANALALYRLVSLSAINFLLDRGKRDKQVAAEPSLRRQSRVADDSHSFRECWP
eukprot:1155473-Pelagomonas_calceolata.AAC.4